MTEESVQGLSERAAELLLDADARIVFCDVSGVVPTDLAALDCLARLCLLADRRDVKLRFIHLPSQLEELFTLCGFETVLGNTDAIRLDLDVDASSD